MRPHSYHVFVFGLLAAAAIGAGVWAILPASSTSAPQPWPAFDMTYRKANHVNTATGETSYQTWQLSYDKDSSWEQRLLEDTEYPANVGSVQSFDGATYHAFDALANTTFENKSEDGALTAPGEWFVPRGRAWFVKQGYAATDGTGNAYKKAERIDCPRDLIGRAAEVPCDADRKVEADSDITVDDHAIPLRVVDTIAGTPTVSLEALKFSVR